MGDSLSFGGKKAVEDYCATCLMCSLVYIAPTVRDRVIAMSAG